MKGIGPDKYPYHTRSPLARELNKLDKVYYSDAPVTDQTPCPLCGEPGHCYPLEIIGYIVPCPDGRIRGSDFTADPKTLYEISSHAHLPLAHRPRLPTSFTKVRDAATNFYDLNPDQIDPGFEMEPEEEGEDEEGETP